MTIETYDPNSAPLASVTMTQAAIAHVKKQLDRSNAAVGVRLAVKKSGCSGFKYDIEFIETLVDDDIAVEVGDGITLYIAADAKAFVDGTEIDYIREGLNSTIKFNNPNAKDLCGCGESFSV